MVEWRFQSEMHKAPSWFSSKPKSNSRVLTQPEPQNAKRTNNKTNQNHKRHAQSASAALVKSADFDLSDFSFRPVLFNLKVGMHANGHTHMHACMCARVRECTCARANARACVRLCMRMRAPKQEIPLAPCKGRGRFPAHEEDRLCLPLDSVGPFLGKAVSITTGTP